MDKNIRAELFSLRNEVLTNLKNIESVVSKIDTKLQEEDNVSCLSRCPEIALLLQQCKKIQWHPDTPEPEKERFNHLVRHIDGVMSTIQADKYADQVADLVKLVKTMDHRMGPPVTGMTENEKYWERISPGTTDFNLTHLYKDVKLPEVPQETLEEAKHLLEQKLSEKEPTEPDTSQAPAWARDVDSKSMNQIIKDAMVWDEINQQLFVQDWNSTFKTRLDTLQVCLETAALDILNIKPPQQMNISNMQDAQNALELFQLFSEVQQKMAVSLREFKDNCQQALQDVEDDCKFFKYYEYLTNFVSSIPSFRDSMITIKDPGVIDHLFWRYTHLVNEAIQEHELTIYEFPFMIDPQTFEPKAVPQPQLAAFKKNRYDKYTKDLKHAYEFIAQQATVGTD